MNLLPHWCLTDKNPAFYDTDSKTAIEQTARIYAAMQELITEYNSFVDSVNQHITVFENAAEKDYEVFTTGIRQAFQDFIDVIELKVKAQDKAISDKFEQQDADIENAIKYMKSNLNSSITQMLEEIRENGEMTQDVLIAFNDIVESITAEATERNAADSTLQQNINSESVARSAADSTLQQSINTLSERMNTFTTLPDGSTAGDAELADARTDYTGKTWENVGSHIRGVSNQLSSEIEYVELQLDIEKMDVLRGYLFVGMSYSSEGVFTPNSEMIATEKLGIVNGKITCDATIKGYCLFDKNMNFIERIMETGKEIVVNNTNAVYCALIFDANVNPYEMLETTTVTGLFAPMSKTYQDIVEDVDVISKKMNEQIVSITNLKDLLYENMAYSGTGIFQVNNAFDCTEKLIVKSGYTISTEYTIAFIATFDTNGDFIERLGIYSTSYDISDKVGYVALMFSNTIASFEEIENQSVNNLFNTEKGEFDKRISKLEEHEVNVATVTIKKSGGDYSGLRECFESITPSKKTPYIVEIYEGEYDIKSEYTDEEWNAESGFYGLFVPDYVTLKGIGNREDIIITATSETTRQYVSTLNLRGTATIENVTVYGNGMRYIIHDDFGSLDGSKCVRKVKDCIIKGGNSHVGALYGSAVRNGSDWEFTNCEFISEDDAVGFRNHNWTGWTDCAKIHFSNCRMNVMRLSTLLNDTNNINTYVTLYGNKIDTLQLDEEDASLYGAGCLYKVSGYGNVIGETIIRVTDGNDYSKNIDLI